MSLRLIPPVLFIVAALESVLAGVGQTLSSPPPEPAPVNEAILQPTETSRLLPISLFLRGEQLLFELRNSSGVRYSDGVYLLTAIIDSSGHASGAQQGVEAGFFTEVPLDMNGHKLKPGVYGISVDGHHRFILMDIAAHRIFATDSNRDLRLLHPRPLQILSGSQAHGYRLYLGRDYVALSREDQPSK